MIDNDDDDDDDYYYYYFIIKLQVYLYKFCFLTHQFSVPLDWDGIFDSTIWPDIKYRHIESKP